MMKLENLSNELLLEIFEHLSADYLLQAFYDLNQRFNNLIINHFQLFTVSFPCVSRSKFVAICEKYVPILADRIQHLKLSNSDETPKQIDQFLYKELTIRQFIHLRSFILCDLCSAKTMNKIVLELQYLSNLSHLTIAGCYLSFTEIESQQLIDSIWSLPKLVYCYLNVYFGRKYIFAPTIQSLSLKALSIWGFEHDQNEINNLFLQTPNLEYLSILLNIDSNMNDINDENRYALPSLKKLSLFLSRINESSLVTLFKRMISLHQLTIDLHYESPITVDGCFCGHQWENIIREYLPNLNKFRLRIEADVIDLTEIDEYLQSYSSRFWINEHQWFVKCHWLPMDNTTSICLYTLPYSFINFTYNSSMRCKSTCPNENFYKIYDSVQNLRYEKMKTENNNSFSIEFSNIHDLSLELPFENCFWSLIPKLSLLNSLTISMEDDNFSQSELQIKSLFDKIFHLKLLTIQSASLVVLNLFQSEFHNLTINQINLQMYDQNLTYQQSSLLCSSALLQKCRVLFITVPKHRFILHFIKNMTNLMTLDIEVDNDEIECEQFLTSLSNYLPSTAIINRDDVFYSHLQIWI